MELIFEEESKESAFFVHYLASIIQSHDVVVFDGYEMGFVEARIVHSCSSKKFKNVTFCQYDT